MTDTISDRLRKYRSGVIWTIKENIVSSFALILVAVCWDHLVNLAIILNFYSPIHEVTHPLKFGSFQLLILTLGSLQLLRKTFDLRKYS